MNANETQVGGNHYRSTFQHWDLVIRLRLGYFEAQVVKYVTRHRAKNGRQDLEKALHFLLKLIEAWSTAGWRQQLHFNLPNVCTVVGEYAHANRLTSLEKDIVYLLCAWHNTEDLERASTLLTGLVGECYRDVTLPWPKPARQYEPFGDSAYPSTALSVAADADAYRGAFNGGIGGPAAEEPMPPKSGGGDFAGGGASGSFDSGSDPGPGYTNQD